MNSQPLSSLAARCPPPTNHLPTHCRRHHLGFHLSDAPTQGTGSSCVHSRVLFKRKLWLRWTAGRCGVRKPIMAEAKQGVVEGWGHGAWTGGGLSSPKSACQALKENTTRSFNSGRQTQPRGRCQTAVWSLRVGNLLLFIDG